MAEVMIRRRKFSMFWNGLPEYTYTGQSEQIDEGPGPDGKHNWQIRFLTSGTLTFKRCGKEIDVFLLGGGGGGSGGGGAGGYTKTVKGVSTPEFASEVVVGAGGEGGAMNKDASDGLPSSFLTYSAKGGGACYGGLHGGDGGSGGAEGGIQEKAVGGHGGSDGSDAYGGRNGDGSPDGKRNGKGQGTTTRDFGDPDGILRAGGGSGRRGNVPGGEGGGGSNGYKGTDMNGLDGYGGGGGGTEEGSGGGFNGEGGRGGSGIVIIRNARK